MNESQHIPFIYEYCDRWCERCAFTQRCAVANEEAKLSRTQKDFTNEAFWQDLSEKFKNVIEALSQQMIAAGIDPTQIHESDVEDNESLQKNGANAENTAITEQFNQLGRNYSAQVRHWFQVNDALLTLKKGRNPEFDDAIEVIRWYQHFVAVKARRACTSLGEPDLAPNDPLPDDKNGSAKVALIAAERSIGAWETVRTVFPDMTDSLLDIFIPLAKIRTDIKTFFPKAEAYKRPGLDT